MNVLVACEESQRVCIAFRNKQHQAFSCDILNCSGGHSEWHIQSDVLPLLDGNCEFNTVDGVNHKIVGKWDLIIAHPPCTYLSNAGACRLYPEKGHLNLERYEKGLAAKSFFMKILNADCEKICIENPIPSKIYGLPPYSQIVQPYEYGEHYRKKTCLWLKGLPKLKPTNIVSDNIICWVSAGSKDNKGNPRKNKGIAGQSKIRSKTFTGIANAMSEQWEVKNV